MPIAGISGPSSDFTGPFVSVRNPILNGYIFDAGLNFPETSSIITEKFGKKYKLTTLLNRMGAMEATPNDTFSWFIQDRQRQSATISSGVSGLPTASLTLTLDTVAAGANLGYFVAGDLIRTEAGVILRVNSVGDAGGFQTITVGKPGGANIASGEIANSELIGHISNAFEEGSTGPNSRLVFPDEEYNYTQIYRRGCKVTGTALTQKTWVLGGKAWYWKNEEYTMDEFAYDQELALMFGVRSVNGARKTTGGIWDRIVTSGLGQVQNFASGTGIAETDLQAIITKLNRQNGSDNLLVLAGSEAITDIEIALKPYYMNGGVDYGSAGSLGSLTVGLGTKSYVFGGKTLTITHYPLFDDDKALPFVSTPTSTKTNFRHAALILDLGNTDQGESLIKLRYKAHDGEQRKFIHKVIPGMHGSTDGTAASSFDGFEVQYLAEWGVEQKLPNQSAVLLPTS